ncbi:MAG: tetratricopeptide repeat protein [Pseudomonadota bacterium]
MRFGLAAVLICLPALSFAAGSSSDAPPTPTKTTTECQEGMVYDESAKECVAPKESRLDDDTLFDAVREFAYAGQYQHAQDTLSAMRRQDGRYMTYMGFTERKMGNLDAAMGYYQTALMMDPSNLLARSYMGQAFVEEGKLSLARAELSQIRKSGGRNTWAETSLKLAIERGKGFAY